MIKDSLFSWNINHVCVHVTYNGDNIKLLRLIES